MVKGVPAVCEPPTPCGAPVRLGTPIFIPDGCTLFPKLSSLVAAEPVPLSILPVALDK